MLPQDKANQAIDALNTLQTICLTEQELSNIINNVIPHTTDCKPDIEELINTMQSAINDAAQSDVYCEFDAEDFTGEQSKALLNKPLSLWTLSQVKLFCANNLCQDNDKTCPFYSLDKHGCSWAQNQITPLGWPDKSDVQSYGATDIEDAKAIKRVLPWARYVIKTKKSLYIRQNISDDIAQVETAQTSMFPSVKVTCHDKIISLEEVLAQEKKAGDTIAEP